MDWLYHFIPGWNKFFTIPSQTAVLQTEDITFYFDSLIQGLALFVFVVIFYYWIKYAFLNFKILYDIKKCPNNPNKGSCPINNILFKNFYNEFVWENGFAKSTVDPSEYFNSKSLYPVIASSHFKTFAVSLLVGLGVLGTFVGLTLGLGKLDFTGNSDQIILQIKDMTACASTAFVTSVWGVLTSLIINFFFSLVSLHLSRQEQKIKRKLLEKFPLYSPVDTFITDVRENLKGSKDTLDGLAEEIGKRLQVNMEEIFAKVSEYLGSSLEKSIVPAIDKLVLASNDLMQKNEKRSEQSLKVLVEQFAERLGQEGNNQRLLMEEASQKLRDALNDNSALFKNTFEEFIEYANQNNDKMKNIFNDMGVKVNDVVDESIQLFKQERELLAATSTKLQNVLQENIQQQSEHENEIFRRNKDLINSIENLLNSHYSKLNEFIQIINNIIEKFREDQNDEIHKMIEQNKQSIKSTLDVISSKQLEISNNAICDLQNQFQNMISSSIDMFAEERKEMINVSNKLQDMLIQHNENSQKYEEAIVNKTKTYLDAMSAANDDQIAQINSLFANANNSYNSVLEKGTNFLQSMYDNQNMQIAKQSETIENNINKLSTIVFDNMQNSVELSKDVGEMHKKLSETIDNINQLPSKFNNLCITLNESSSNMNNMSNKIIDTMRNVDGNIESKLDNVLSMVNANKEMINQVKITSSDLYTTSNILKDTSKILETQNNLVQRQNKALETNIDNWSTILSDNIQHVTAISKEMSAMHEKLSETINTMKQLPSQFNTLCTSISESSTTMNNMSDKIIDTMRSVDANIKNNLENVTSIVNVNKEILSQVKNTSVDLSTTSNMLKDASKTLETSTMNAIKQLTIISDNFTDIPGKIYEYLNDIDKSINTYMQNYNTNVNKLLEDFGKQVTQQTADRLRQWDKETENFIRAFSAVVDSLGEAVENFESSQHK